MHSAHTQQDVGACYRLKQLSIPPTIPLPLFGSVVFILLTLTLAFRSCNVAHCATLSNVHIWLRSWRWWAASTFQLECVCLLAMRFWVWCFFYSLSATVAVPICLLCTLHRCNNYTRSNFGYLMVIIQWSQKCIEKPDANRSFRNLQ